MDLDFISDFYMPVVVLACLCIGFCIKHIKWLERVSNQYIPTIMLVLGALFGCLAATQISFKVVVAGAVSGLASTGLHQAFSQLLGQREEDGDV